MEKGTFLQVFITVLVICSMLFAKYSIEQRKGEDAITVMAYGNGKSNKINITFSDLAEKIDTVIGGEKNV